MNMSLNELYEAIIKSLSDSSAVWEYRDHYHKFKGGIGIPYKIFNKDLGVSIWLANGFTFCNISILSNSELPSIGLIRKWILYRKCMGLFKTEALFDIPVSKQSERDIKLDKVLKKD